MFEIFRDGGGHWCARRLDGLVGGVFRDRAEAERFARLEDEIPGSGKTGGPSCNAAAPALSGKSQA